MMKEKETIQRLRKLLEKALLAARPTMGDMSPHTGGRFCKDCVSSSVHDPGFYRCVCWCHDARAALAETR